VSGVGETTLANPAGVKPVGVARTLEHFYRALHIRRHIFGRMLDRRHDIADARKMKNVARTTEERAAGLQVAHVAHFQRKIRICRLVDDIAFAPADKIVDRPHAVPLAEQVVDHVTADKTCPAGDYGNGLGGHLTSSLFMRLTL